MAERYVGCAVRLRLPRAQGPVAGGTAEPGTRCVWINVSTLVIRSSTQVIRSALPGFAPLCGAVKAAVPGGRALHGDQACALSLRLAQCAAREAGAPGRPRAAAEGATLLRAYIKKNPGAGWPRGSRLIWIRRFSGDADPYSASHLRKKSLLAASSPVSTAKKAPGSAFDAPREVCELALAHVNSDRVEAAYRRTDLFERRRELMEQWAAFLGRS